MATATIKKDYKEVKSINDTKKSKENPKIDNVANFLVNPNDNKDNWNNNNNGTK